MSEGMLLLVKEKGGGSRGEWRRDKHISTHIIEVGWWGRIRVC